MKVAARTSAAGAVVPHTRTQASIRCDDTASQVDKVPYSVRFKSAAAVRPVMIACEDSSSNPPILTKEAARRPPRIETTDYHSSSESSGSSHTTRGCRRYRRRQKFIRLIRHVENDFKKPNPNPSSVRMSSLHHGMSDDCSISSLSGCSDDEMSELSRRRSGSFQGRKSIQESREL
jgi:hypothetical protein